VGKREEEEEEEGGRNGGRGREGEVESEILFCNYEIFMFLVVLSLVPRPSACVKKV